MDKEAIVELVKTFESFSKKSDEGIEFWLARDLQKLMGYLRWENFQTVIEKAKTSCLTSGNDVPDHFREVTKMIQLPKDAEREVTDIILTRYACYLIAQNGDPRKEQIAFAQAYFAVQTRKMEIIEQRLYEVERVSARKKLAETEKKLSGVIFEFTGTDKNFGIIRSKGDKALFNYSTEEMKIKEDVKKVERKLISKTTKKLTLKKQSKE